MPPLMASSAKMSVNTIHSQLCLLASLKEQWREKRTPTQDQGADNPERYVLLQHDGYLHAGQTEEEGRETTESRTHRESTSVSGNDRAELQNE